MNFLRNEEPYLRVTEYLKYKNSKRKENEKWNISAMKPMPSFLYANKKVDVGGTVSLLTGSSVAKRGVTNFDGNSLVKGRVFVANGITFKCAIDDANKPEQDIAYSIAKVPNTLMQSMVVVKQKNEILIELPICDILGATESGNHYFKLGSFALLEDDTITEIEIQYPEGAKITLEDGKALFASARLSGFATYQKR
ncbi:hypothetical protein [Tenacibaculum discolor]|uniref:hypothetical protein n=1 Tax=Tenacibaculum discolor TaxID=361581 RepID=UPI000EAE5508|nr:hypothetical protein [Tenacibaculum discolor]RLK06752.1 hypothetical protein C8N27_0313 [Tenacibaculum discolor]